MSRILVFTLLITTFGWTACSQQESEPVADNGQSLLWRIEGNGLEQPSYLYGTIHLISQKDFVFTKRMKSIIAKSKQVAFEMDLNMEDMMKAALQAVYKGDTTLAMFYSPAEYDTLHRFFMDTLGVSPMEWEIYKKTKPFFLIEVFYSANMEGTPVSFELEFKAFADSLEIPVVGLETMAEQMGFVNAIPQEDQFDMLLRSVREFRSDQEMMDELVQFYKEGALDSIDVLMQAYPEFSDIEESLLYNRNRNWVSRIDSLIQDKPTFIAVGAGHLPGEKGVINLLREAGYTLTPIEIR